MNGDSDSRANCTDRRGFLKISAGAASIAVGIPAISGSAVAHFPEGLSVDVKPGSDANPINPNKDGVIPVAVLQTDEFDPTNENVNYRFGAPDIVEEGRGARPKHDGHVSDIDGDGNDDLLLHFPTEKTGFDSDNERARLEWERDEQGAEHGLSGTDSVTIVGQRR